MRDYWDGEILSLLSHSDISSDEQPSDKDVATTDLQHGELASHSPDPLSFASKLMRASSSPIETAKRRLNRYRLIQQFSEYRKLNGAEYTSNTVGSFEGWARAHLDSIDVHSVRSYIDQLHHQPLISIVLPLYRPDLTMLRETIKSVSDQIYPNWQLCIVDDHSDDHDLEGYLANLSRQESRLDFLRREKSGGIAMASNDAIALAKGEYVCLLDQGDQLTPDALAWIAAAVVNNPQAELLYSDEDKTNGKERLDPYFKPDFDPLLLLGQNYLTRLLTIRRKLLLELGGLRLEIDGAHDWDLVLRATERISPSEVVHIPKILYHWWIADDTILMSLGIENEVYDSGRKAVADALSRRSIKALLEPAKDAAFKLLHFKPESSSKVAIVISAISEDVAGLVSQLGHPLIKRLCSELIIVSGSDSSSELRSCLASLESEGVATIIERGANTNLAATYNELAARLTSKYICLIDDTVRAEDPSWLTELVGVADGMGLAVVSPLIVSFDREIRQAGLVLGVDGEAAARYYGEPETATGHRNRLTIAQQVSAVTSEMVLINRESYLAVGGMDEHFGGFLGDLDLCLKFGANNERVGYTPAVRCVRTAPDGDSLPPQDGEELIAFWGKWRSELTRDPFYNQNLITSNASCAPTLPRVYEPWHTDWVLDEYPFCAPGRSLPANPVVLSPGGHLLVHLPKTPTYTRVTLWIQTNDNLPSLRISSGGRSIEQSFAASATQFTPITVEVDGEGDIEVTNTSDQEMAFEAYNLATTQLLRIHTARQADFLIDTLGVQGKTQARKRSH